MARCKTRAFRPTHVWVCFHMPGVSCFCGKRPPVTVGTIFLLFPPLGPYRHTCKQSRCQSFVSVCAVRCAVLARLLPLAVVYHSGMCVVTLFTVLNFLFATHPVSPFPSASTWQHVKIVSCPCRQANNPALDTNRWTDGVFAMGVGGSRTPCNDRALMFCHPFVKTTSIQFPRST